MRDKGLFRQLFSPLLRFSRKPLQFFVGGSTRRKAPVATLLELASLAAADSQQVPERSPALSMPLYLQSDNGIGLISTFLFTLQQNDNVCEDRNAKDGGAAGMRRLREKDPRQVKFKKRKRALLGNLRFFSSLLDIC